MPNQSFQKPTRTGFTCQSSSALKGIEILFLPGNFILDNEYANFMFVAVYNGLKSLCNSKEAENTDFQDPSKRLGVPTQVLAEPKGFST